MTPQQRLIQSSFLKVLPKREAFARSFYDRLFTAFPETKPLFAHTDMRQQQNKLMAALSLAVNNVHNIESVADTLNKLGHNHVGYHVKPHHYAMVGDALLATLAETLGDAWTPQHKEAWAGAYAVLVKYMCRDAAVGA